MTLVAGGSGRQSSRFLEPRPSIEQGPRTAMTSSTAEVIELKQPHANRIATKDLYEIGEIPPLGHVPANMYAWAIRKDRHGEPISAMQQEVVPVATVGDDECLVMVMAAGVNYNGVWAALGIPLSPLDVHKQPYHIAGSDASGIVYAVGSQGEAVEGRRRGRHPLQPGRRRRRGVQRRRSDELGHRSGSGATRPPTARFAQFCKVQSRQLMPRPKHLTWEEAACYTLVLATAYRMLFGHQPHALKPGDNVLVWGGAGGLGSMAIQLIAASGGNAIAVISEEDKRDFVMSLGAKGAINRKDFDCWGEMPDPMDKDAYGKWLSEARKFGKAIWDITGKGNDVDIVFEHPAPRPSR